MVLGEGIIQVGSQKLDRVEEYI